MTVKKCNTCKIFKKSKYFYKRTDSKDGLFSECVSCCKLRSKEYRKNNVEQIRKNGNSEAAIKCRERYRHRFRKNVLNKYGNKCACCGETESKFMSIDHVYGRKNKKYKKEPKSHNLLYLYLSKKNKRLSEYQLLCYNCNCAKGFYGVCPHKLRETKIEVT